MNGKRIVVDCSTGKEMLVGLDAEFLAQRELDAENAAAQKIIEDTKQERDKKINDELIKMAEERLIARGEL